MRRWILYIAILALVVAAPAKPVNIGDLLPIRVVAVYREDNRFRIATDTGDLGFGDTVSLALHSMRDTASGIIYLDTAEYLLVETETMGYLEELKGYLKPKTQVCVCDQKVDLEQVPEYLAVHKSRVNLKESAGNREIPRLVEEKGKLMLERA